MSFQFEPINSETAQTVLSWIYRPPYHVYNEEPARIDQLVQELLRPEYHYFTLAEGNDALVAYCCFGLDARVLGGEYDEKALDLGLMVRPDLNGLGRGVEYARAVLEFARAHFPQRQWRVTIAEFNRRAQRVWRRLGFERVQIFAERGDGMLFGQWLLKPVSLLDRDRGLCKWKDSAGARITGPTNRI